MSLGFTFDDIKNFLLSNGGRAPYHELVKHFKSALSHPQTQAEARIIFKDYVNTLATVSNEQNQKYIVLRPQYLTISSHALPPMAIAERADLNTVGLPSAGVDKRRSHSLNHGYHHPHHYQQAPTQMAIIEQNNFWQRTQPNNGHLEVDDYPPQPPPRRRSSSSGTKTRIEDRFRPFNDDEQMEKENSQASPPHQDKLKEIHELTAKSPGRVKEHAQKINKMASELELKPPMPVNGNANLIATNRATSQKIRVQNNADDTDSGSVQPLDPLRRKWIITASSCNYNELVTLLKEEPKLASYKDFTCGYTAIHWAAKFGNKDIIKLIAGTFGVNPNIKSHGGFTPLHLAAMNKHEEVMDLLIKTYQADDKIRDHSGKRPSQYLASPPQDKKKIETPSNTVQLRSTESTASFIRIGSMKAASKMKKLTSGLAKNWGSAESLTENHGFTKSQSKKHKKGKKTISEQVAKDSDSDSAYGFNR